MLICKQRHLQHLFGLGQLEGRPSNRAARAPDLPGPLQALGRRGANHEGKLGSEFPLRMDFIVWLQHTL